MDRDELLQLCTDGVVPEDRWRNRDSSAAQRQLGEARALLAAGCDFFIEPEVNHRAHWVHVNYKGFDSFEYGDDAPLKSDRFYVPTRESLTAAAGGDWY